MARELLWPADLLEQRHEHAEAQRLTEEAVGTDAEAALFILRRRAAREDIDGHAWLARLLRRLCVTCARFLDAADSCGCLEACGECCAIVPTHRPYAAWIDP